MTFLELVQRLYYELRLPGTPPATVTGLTGLNGDLVRWTAEAYKDIQRDHNGRWRWLRGEARLNTSGVEYYNPRAASGYTEVSLSKSIGASFETRFRAWDIANPDDRPRAYVTADGSSSEYRLIYLPWFDFKELFLLGDMDEGKVSYISADENQWLWLALKPTDSHRVFAHCWLNAQTLEDDDDEPEMPEDFHMAIVYRAMLKYGYSTPAPEVIARVEAEGSPLYASLESDQCYDSFSFSLAGPLA